MSQEQATPEVEAKPQFFLISNELLQAVGGYLGTKPYQEVAGLIEGLKQARPVSVSDDAPAEDAAPAGELKKED